MKEPAGYPHILAVEASAGAGKTFALALRYLKLLARSGAPSPAGLGSILALTFTTAAAQEMKERILAMLKAIALDGADAALYAEASGLDRSAATGWLDLIMRRFALIQVKTIDSLHFQIMQSLGRSLDLSPDARPDFEDKNHVDFALEALLARTRWPSGPDAATGADSPVLDHPDPFMSGIWNRLFDSYLNLEGKKGFGLVRWIRGKSLDIFSLLKSELRDIERDAPDKLRASRQDLKDTAWAVLSDLNASGLMPHLSRLKPEDATRYLSAPEDNLDKAFFRKSLPEEIFKKSGQNLTAVEPFMALYVALRRAAESYLFARAAARVAAFADLHALFIETMTESARQGRAIPGGWWTRLLRQKARDIDIALEASLVLGYAWKHIMIDEFQDTSREQWDVLRELAVNALSEGGSLFYVGDVKQAIYGWRGGDWRLFAEPLKPEVLPSVEEANRIRTSLPANWRSGRAIVELSGAAFGSLAEPAHAAALASDMLPDKEDTAPLAEVIRAIYAFAPQETRRDFPAVIRARAIASETDEEFVQASLDGLTAEILALRQAGTFRMRDMAVLVRRNADAAQVASALLDAGIATVTEQSLRLDHSPLIRGLLGLLQWLENPEDNLSLYGFLQSPLTQEGPRPALDVLLAEPGRGEAVLLDLRPEFHARFLAPLRKRAGYAGPYEMLVAAADVLGLDGLPPDRRSYVEKILETAFASESEGVQSLSSFLAYWDKEKFGLTMSLPDSLDAVRVMTIHKSKGLEFPAVFLPLLQWPGRQPGANLLLAEDENHGLYPVATSAPRAATIEAIRSRNMRDSRVEELNMLYVAVTRASRHLSLTYPAEPGKDAATWLRAMAGWAGAAGKDALA